MLKCVVFYTFIDFTKMSLWITELSHPFVILRHPKAPRTQENLKSKEPNDKLRQKYSWLKTQNIVTLLAAAMYHNLWTILMKVFYFLNSVFKCWFSESFIEWKITFKIFWWGYVSSIHKCCILSVNESQSKTEEFQT